MNGYTAAVAGTALRVLGGVLDVLDVVQAGVDLWKVITGRARLRWGGGGDPGTSQKGGTDASGTSGASKHAGSPDAVGAGAGPAGGGPIGADAGDGGGQDAAADAGADANADDRADDYLDELSFDDDDGVDSTDAAGSSTLDAPPPAATAGPGAGRTTGTVPSFLDQAGGNAAAHQDEPAAAATAGNDQGNAAMAVPVDPVTSAPDAAPADDASHEPPALVDNPAAARVLSSMHALGEPVTPAVIELLDMVVPPDLPPDEVSALIDRLMTGVPNATKADPDQLMAALARTIDDFLLERETKPPTPKPDAKPEAGGGGHGGGGDSDGADRGSGAGAGGAPAAHGADAGSAAHRPHRAGGGGGLRPVARPPRPKRPAKGAKQRTWGGTGLTPTMYDDGRLALSRSQAERWIVVEGDTVKRSAAATAWVGQNAGRLARGGDRSQRLRDADVSGVKLDVGRYRVTIAFTFETSEGAPAPARINFYYEPGAAVARRTAQQQPSNLAPLEAVVERRAGLARLPVSATVDLGGFRAVIKSATDAYPDADDTHATFLVTLEVVEVRDPALVSWMGHQVAIGAIISTPVRLRLEPR